MGYRNQRELHTLAEVLDRLAAGETGRAAFGATVQSRRALATRRRLVATHLELLPPSGRHLTPREEETLVAKEPRDEVRVKRYLQEGGTSSQGPGKRRGRGSGAPRPEDRKVSVRRDPGVERERSRDGKTRRRIRRRLTGSGVAAGKWGPADARRVEWGLHECPGRKSFVPEVVMAMQFVVTCKNNPYNYVKRRLASCLGCFVWARKRTTLDKDTVSPAPGVATRGAEEVLHLTNTRNDDFL